MIDPAKLQIGDKLYEYGYGRCVESIVKTVPVLSDKDPELWSWTSTKVSDGTDLFYAQTKGNTAYALNLYDHEACIGTK